MRGIIMREKTIAKSIALMLLTFMVTVAMLFVSADANAAIKKVKKGDWKKITAGKLTKKQAAYALNHLTYFLSSNKSKITTKDWRKDNKTYGGFMLLGGFKIKYTSKGAKIRRSNVNRVLAFCDTYRIKKNKKTRFWSSGNKYVLYRELQNLDLDTPKITSAKRDKKGMIVKFNVYGPDNSLYQKHTAYFKKLKKGTYKRKFRVYKIVKNWQR